ncbi:MAG: hypothetical protein ACFBSE_25070, partial [Prochloraceae cyanobacterium]
TFYLKSRSTIDYSDRRVFFIFKILSIYTYFVGRFRLIEIDFKQYCSVEVRSRSKRLILNRIRLPILLNFLSLRRYNRVCYKNSLDSRSI